MFAGRKINNSRKARKNVISRKGPGTLIEHRGKDVLIEIYQLNRLHSSA